jgi:flagellar basal-body rod protein FlgC
MFGTIFNIASNAMSANRLRINTIASNLANAETTRTEEGGPYKRRDVVFAATDLKTQSFDGVMDEASLKSVKVAAVVTDDKDPMMVYDPTHPDADKATGMVAMPNISPVTEMVNMMSASNAYKAAAEIVTVTKEMAAALRNLSSTV